MTHAVYRKQNLLAHKHATHSIKLTCMAKMEFTIVPVHIPDISAFSHNAGFDRKKTPHVWLCLQQANPKFQLSWDIHILIPTHCKKRIHISVCIARKRERERKAKRRAHTLEGLRWTRMSYELQTVLRIRRNSFQFTSGYRLYLRQRWYFHNCDRRVQPFHYILLP
jgi:hypothetical protein